MMWFVCYLHAVIRPVIRRSGICFMTDLIKKICERQRAKWESQSSCVAIIMVMIMIMIIVIIIIIMAPTLLSRLRLLYSLTHIIHTLL